MLRFQDLIDQPVLDVDAPRNRTLEIADQRLVRRRDGERIRRDDLKKLFCLGTQSASRQSLGVLLRLMRLDQRPAHHFSSFAQRLTGVRIPS